MSQEEIDGALVGGASLDAKSFACDCEILIREIYSRFSIFKKRHAEEVDRSTCRGKSVAYIKTCSALERLCRVQSNAIAIVFAQMRLSAIEQKLEKSRALATNGTTAMPRRWPSPSSALQPMVPITSLESETATKTNISRRRSCRVLRFRTVSLYAPGVY